MNYSRLCLFVALAFCSASYVCGQSFECGTDLYGNLGIRELPNRSDKHANVQGIDALREIKLAVETDSKFYAENGGTEESATAYARLLVSEVSRIFEREIGARLVITSMKTWTTANQDPYQCNGDGVALGQKALAYWKDETSTPRDIVLALTSGGGGGIGYMFTNKDGGGVTSICTPSAVAGASPFAAEALPSTSFTYSVYIVAHELGHVLGAVHSHNCYWNPPLDTCVVLNHPQFTSGDACLSTPNEPKPNAGSLMSYCTGINVASGWEYSLQMTFLDKIETYLQDQLSGTECNLEPASPVVFLLSPHGGTASGGTPITITWRAQGMDNVVVEWQPEGAADWTEITQRPSLLLDEIEWTLPEYPCATNIFIRVRSSTDQMIADTSVLPVRIQATSTTCLRTELTVSNGAVHAASCVQPEAGYGGVAGKDRFDSTGGAWSMNNVAPIVFTDNVGPETEGTLLLWFTTSRNNGVQHLVGTDWQQVATASLMIWEGTLGSAVWTTGASVPIQAWGPSITPNEWYQVALTYTNTEQRLYVNGKVVDTQPLPGPAFSHLASCFIGKRGQNNEPFFGSIDDVRIYTCALSADSLASLYEAERVKESEPNSVAGNDEPRGLTLHQTPTSLTFVLPPTEEITRVVVVDVLGRTWQFPAIAEIGIAELSTGAYVLNVCTLHDQYVQPFTICR